MKGSTILTFAALGLGAYYLFKQSSNNQNLPDLTSSISPLNTNSDNLDLVNAIKSGNTTPTPTGTPSHIVVKTTKKIAKITGIKQVTNTMPVTKEVSNALKGTFSPLTGKLRI